MLKSTHHTLDPKQLVYWLILKDELVWLTKSSPYFPLLKSQDLGIDSENIDALMLGKQQEHDVYLLDANDLDLNLLSDKLTLDDFTWLSIKDAVILLPQAVFELIAKASQFAFFHQTHQYCGRCGRRMKRVKWEVANHCFSCHHRCYPKLSPCIIVAITRNLGTKTEILLAKGKRSSSAKFSVLAGFVEPGETIEAAVEREVMEEVGISICNVKYFASQAWPFPHNLMLGFVAEYDSGEIEIDPKEIAEAGWFDIKQLPEVPRPYSIAGRLIEYSQKMHNLSED